MKKTLVIILGIIGGIVLSAIIFGAGLFLTRTNSRLAGNNLSRMFDWDASNNTPGYPMRGGDFYRRDRNNLFSGNGMMENFRPGNVASAAPLTIDQTEQAIENYLKRLNNSDLELTEIMIFDNNGYAIITEKSTGIGAMELLVDPVSLSVFPEYGPNMMWNLKYGHMRGSNRVGMMGGLNTNPGFVSASMTVTPDQAAKIAQQYLDDQFPGYRAAMDPDPFYGYYTIDILKEGNPTGMLSVNGFSEEVFLHTWHGTFIEMSE